jgi:hypothetical protein
MKALEVQLLQTGQLCVDPPGKMAPDFGSSTRHIRRRISRYGAVDVTPVTGKRASKMWDGFYRGSNPAVA